ncbi:MAG: DUF1573 domain-containing protein [Fimbriiglobus sp.]
MSRRSAVWFAAPVLAAVLGASGSAEPLPEPAPLGTANGTPSQAAGPWANKLFVPNILQFPVRPAPPTIAHDFGTVPHGTLCAQKFTITNIYDVPIQVLDVRRSCGCLEALPPQKVLQPNESAEFAVTMNTAKFSGPNTQTIYVTFGPNFISTAVLRITANSRTDIELSPGNVNFGTVAVGAKPTQFVTLEYHGRQRDWKLVGVIAPTGPIVVEARESGRGFLGAKYSIAVALKPDAPAGPLQEVISLKTNDPAAPLVQVQVVGVVQSPVMLSTPVVRFENVKVGEIATQKVMARAPAGPFRFEPVVDPGDGVYVETFPAPAPVQILTVRFAPTEIGKVRKEIVLHTDVVGGTAKIVIEADGVE